MLRLSLSFPSSPYPPHRHRRGRSHHSAGRPKKSPESRYGREKFPGAECQAGTADGLRPLRTRGKGGAVDARYGRRAGTWCRGPVGCPRRHPHRPRPHSGRRHRAVGRTGHGDSADTPPPVGHRRSPLPGRLLRRSVGRPAQAAGDRGRRLRRPVAQGRRGRQRRPDRDPLGPRAGAGLRAAGDRHLGRPAWTAARRRFQLRPARPGRPRRPAAPLGRLRRPGRSARAAPAGPAHRRRGAHRRRSAPNSVPPRWPPGHRTS